MLGEPHALAGQPVDVRRAADKTEKSAGEFVYPYPPAQSKQDS